MLMNTDWDAFEKVLLTEFCSILSNFKRIESLLSSDTRKDFMGLLHYILNDRSSFRAVARTEFDIEHVTKDIVLDTEGFDAEEFLKNINKISPDRLQSFSPEFTKFSLLLEVDNLTPALISDIHYICEQYWDFTYPSLKESFVIPFASKFPPPPSSTLSNLLRRRLLKGKLIPFGHSLLLANKLDLRPSDMMDGYFDHQLAALKGILSNYLQDEAELHCVLQQSGCHCD